MVKSPLAASTIKIWVQTDSKNKNKKWIHQDSLKLLICLMKTDLLEFLKKFHLVLSIRHATLQGSEVLPHLSLKLKLSHSVAEAQSAVRQKELKALKISYTSRHILRVKRRKNRRKRKLPQSKANIFSATLMRTLNSIRLMRSRIKLSIALI